MENAVCTKVNQEQGRTRVASQTSCASFAGRTYLLLRGDIDIATMEKEVRSQFGDLGKCSFTGIPDLEILLSSQDLIPDEWRSYDLLFWDKSKQWDEPFDWCAPIACLSVSREDEKWHRGQTNMSCLFVPMEEYDKPCATVVCFTKDGV